MEWQPITALGEVDAAQPDAWRYRVKGAPDGKWHYVDNPELARRIIAVREEDGLGGYLYEIEPLVVMPSGVGVCLICAANHYCPTHNPGEGEAK